MRSGRVRLAVDSFLLLALLGWGPCLAGQDTRRIEGIPSVVKQGGVFRIRLKGDGGGVPSGSFQGNGIPFNPGEDGRGYEGLVGVDLECPAGIYLLTITTEEGSRASSRMFRLEVAQAFFGVQRITLPPGMVDLDPRSLKRVKEEREKIQALWAARSDNRWWEGDFLVPVEGRISSLFGVSRILNGQRRARHNGIDIRARRGEKILCPNGGRVVMVDELFFGGKTVVMDHGQGLYSFFMHLDSVSVRMNQAVRRGDVLGTVGATGRATGAHLHWGVCLNGARVDPLSLMETTSRDPKVIRMFRKRRHMGEKRKKRPKDGEKVGKRRKTLD